jgi:hypothetical protein
MMAVTANMLGVFKVKTTLMRQERSKDDLCSTEAINLLNSDVHPGQVRKISGSAHSVQISRTRHENDSDW